MLSCPLLQIQLHLQLTTWALPVNSMPKKADFYCDGENKSTLLQIYLVSTGHVNIGVLYLLWYKQTSNILSSGVWEEYEDMPIYCLFIIRFRINPTIGFYDIQFWYQIFGLFRRCFCTSSILLIIALFVLSSVRSKTYHIYTLTI